jgi:quercetin dioxygenase-like cupin family protein
VPKGEPDVPEDAAKVAPDVYKVLLENERVRVLEVKTSPGGKSDMHHHPDMAGYAVSDCTWMLTSPDGEGNRVELKAGETFYLPAVDHRAEDVGTAGSHAILIELK